jgi:hypothetical protein
MIHMTAFGTSTDRTCSQATPSLLVSSPVRVSVVSSMRSSRSPVSQDLTRMALLLAARLACVKRQLIDCLIARRDGEWGR